MTVFETERLTVRFPEFERDAEGFFQLNSDPEVMKYIRATKTREETDAFLKEIIAKIETDPARGRWIVADRKTGEYIGSFAIIPTPNTDFIQLGYALLKKHWGKGYASELTKGALKHYFETTNADRIYAHTEIGNTDSQKVLLKNGFTYVETNLEDGKEVHRYVFIRQ